MKIVGQIAAIAGIALVIGGVAGRFIGPPTVLGQFKAINVIIMGISLMVIGCLVKLQDK